MKAAAVVGVTDEKEGEVPAVMVVSERKESDLLAAIGALLQKNEIPVLLKIVDALPLTASGKPDKQRVREVLTQCRNG